MNLKHIAVEDIVQYHIDTGVSLRVNIDKTEDNTIRLLYYKNMRELLVKTIQEHNNIDARTDIFVTSSSAADEDEVNKMESLFMDKLINKLEYESICLVIELINNKLGIEEFKEKMNKLRSKEVLDFIDDNMNKIRG